MAEMGDTTTEQEQSAAKRQNFVKEWLGQIDDARKREKDWRLKAADTVEIYEAKKCDIVPFNILYSNTETLVPAVYNNLPRPVVTRRFKDDDPLGKVAANVAKRTLSYLLDNDVGEYQSFDSAMTATVLNAFVPGRGVTRFKYDPTISYSQPEPTPEMPEPEPQPQVDAETVCVEFVDWDRVLFGYAKTWTKVPFMVFEHFFSRDECVQNFGEEIGRSIKLDVSPTAMGDDKNAEQRGNASVADAQGATLAHIYEVWDKETKRVFFLAAGYPNDVLKMAEDPLRLSGFFPIPQPLMPFAKISSLVPQTLYAVYEAQAKELNRITVRLRHLIEMLKVRGMYDGTVEGIDKVLTAEEGQMIPLENVAGLGGGAGQSILEKALWMMPIEKIMVVIQQLMIERNACKQVIYEITGISDILRGSSAASETATAQEIKAAWGSLRLKRMQKLVMNYVRECLRIMAEIAFQHLSYQTIAQMTGLHFPTMMEKQQAGMVAQQWQQQTQTQLAVMQATGQPPPPEPPQPPPEVQQAMQTSQMPAWEEIMELLGNDIQRNYRIDIETNSTVDAEATEDKQDMSELLNAIAQFMNGIGPLVQQGLMPFEAAKAMLLGTIRRYKLGDEIEDQIEQMQPPAPQGGPSPDEEVKLQIAQIKAQAEQDKANMDKEKMAMEMELAKEEHRMKMEQMQRDSEAAVLKHGLAMQKMQMQKSMPRGQQQGQGESNSATL